MIIKFFSQGTSTAKNIISYLTSEEKHQGHKPEIVSGIPILTQRITEAISRKYKYSTGVISFADGENLSHRKQMSLINEFERTFAPFKDSDRVNFLWVRHFDKGRLELHFVCPMIDLKTKKKFNICPPSKINQRFYREFTALHNFQNGFNQVRKNKYTLIDFDRSNKIVNSMVSKRIKYIIKTYDTPRIKTTRRISHGRNITSNNSKSTNNNIGISKSPNVVGRNSQSNTTSTDSVQRVQPNLDKGFVQSSIRNIRSTTNINQQWENGSNNIKNSPNNESTQVVSTSSEGISIGVIEGQLSSLIASLGTASPNAKAGIYAQISALIVQRNRLYEQIEKKKKSAIKP